MRSSVLKAESVDARLLSPTVGLWVPRVCASDCLEENTVLGRIRQAGRWCEVRVPKGVSGIAKEILGGYSRVECGTVLVELSAGQDEQEVAPLEVGPPDGVEVIAAPMVGILYRQSAPGKPVYAAEGDLVSGNQTIGLVEVMKTLTPIRAPRNGRLLKWLVEDGASVNQDQPIAWLEPQHS
ncbi:MAG: biotin/lipoyl-containing protein [Myxococcota bacterium]|nr:biotin/lipoyl-containing protein [Myxococcota bacterium]